MKKEVMLEIFDMLYDDISFAKKMHENSMTKIEEGYTYLEIDVEGYASQYESEVLRLEDSMGILKRELDKVLEPHERYVVREGFNYYEVFDVLEQGYMYRGNLSTCETMVETLTQLNKAFDARFK